MAFNSDMCICYILANIAFNVPILIFDIIGISQCSSLYCRASNLHTYYVMEISSCCISLAVCVPTYIVLFWRAKNIEYKALARRFLIPNWNNVGAAATEVYDFIVFLYGIAAIYTPNEPPDLMMEKNTVMISLILQFSIGAVVFGVKYGLCIYACKYSRQ